MSRRRSLVSPVLLATVLWTGALSTWISATSRDLGSAIRTAYLAIVLTLLGPWLLQLLLGFAMRSFANPTLDAVFDRIAERLRGQALVDAAAHHELARLRADLLADEYLLQVLPLVRERIEKPELLDENLPTMVYAVKPGIIEKMSALEGTSAFKKGDTVAAGVLPGDGGSGPHRSDGLRPGLRVLRGSGTAADPAGHGQALLPLVL